MFKSTLAAIALIVAATGITGAQTAETQPRSVLTEDATEKRRGIDGIGIEKDRASDIGAYFGV